MQKPLIDEQGGLKSQGVSLQLTCRICRATANRLTLDMEHPTLPSLRLKWKWLAKAMMMVMIMMITDKGAAWGLEPVR